MPRKPQLLLTIVARQSANKYQKAALYPTNRASGLSLSAIFDRMVIELAKTADIARPTDFPICATVLKTPPASACVFSGKEAVMTRLETVNKVSAPMAFNAMAGNANDQ